MKRRPPRVRALLSRHVDPSRLIMLVDEVDWDMVKETGFMLAGYADSPHPVTVRIASSGGKLVCGLAIYDMLRTAPFPVITEAVGVAASSASVILQAGHVRLMAPKARLMIHFGHIELEGALDAQDIAMVAKEIDGRNRFLVRLFAGVTGQPKDRIKAWLKESKEFSAAHAVRYGFADGIVPEPSLDRHLRRLTDLRDRTPSRDAGKAEDAED